MGRGNQVVGEFTQRAADRLLIGKAASSNNGRRRVRCHPGLQQSRGPAGCGRDSHVHHQRARKLRQTPIVERRPLLVVPLLTGDESHRRSQVAVRDRNARVTTGRQGGRDPGYHFELDAVADQHFHLVRRMSKHGRVTALEPHDGLVSLRQLHELRVNLRLRPDARPAVTPQTNPLGRWRGMLEDAGIHQVVVQHDIRPLETLHAPAA